MWPVLVDRLGPLGVLRSWLNWPPGVRSVGGVLVLPEWILSNSTRILVPRLVGISGLVIPLLIDLLELIVLLLSKIITRTASLRFLLNTVCKITLPARMSL